MKLILGTSIAICMGLAGWALAATVSHGERIVAVETRQTESAKLLQEVRDDVKTILREMPRKSP